LTGHFCSAIRKGFEKIPDHDLEVLRMIELEDQAEERAARPSDIKNPICPHCSKDIKKIYMREIKSYLGKRYLYYCADCLKVLGLSHRKGFWMG